MKLVMPKQHGAWAMLFLPFALGVEAGTPTWTHIPLFIGWVLLYLATYPALMAIKRKSLAPFLHSFLFFMIPACLFLSIALWKEWRLVFFGLLMIPFFLINVYYVKKNQERSFLNDLSAVASFGIGGIASYFLGMGKMDLTATTIWILTMLFFIGSIFFVKSMIREKKNSTFRWVSWGYHLVLTLGFLVAGFPWLSLAFLPSTLRAIVCCGKPLSMMSVGILEIMNCLLFLVLFVYFL